MKKISKTQIFRKAKSMTQADLGRLLDVNRSTISRAVKDGMCTDDDGKIILHVYESLAVIVEIMDRRMDVMSRFTPEYETYLELYQTVSNECRPLFMKKYYRG